MKYSELLSIADAQVELAYNNQLRLETMQSGVTVVGLLSATSLSGSAVGLTSVPIIISYRCTTFT